MSHSTRSLPKRCDESDVEPDFVELPQSPPARTAPAPSENRSDVRPPPRPLAAPSDSAVDRRIRAAQGKPLAEEDDQRNGAQRLVHRLLGDEGAAYAISMVFHIILLAILAIPILHQVQEGPIFTTIMADPDEQSSDFTELIDTELTMPEDVLGGAASRELPQMDLDSVQPLTSALFDNSGGATEGQGLGNLNDGALRFVPENAVTAGSFTAWTTPEKRFGFPDPKPGDSPRPKQPYWITIQIEVPDDRKTYPLSDLSGVVIGTDDYTQHIPQDRRSREPTFFVVNEDGEAVPPKRTVRVIDGKVQFRVRVPGARELVKDTIEVSSRMLDESQTLELIFE